MTAVLQDVSLRPETLGDICVGERWVLCGDGFWDAAACWVLGGTKG